MSNQIILIQPLLAAKPPKPPAKSTQMSTDLIWMGATGVLFVLLLGSIVFFKIKTKALTKQVNTEIFRNKELQKKYKFNASKRANHWLNNSRVVLC